MISNRRLLPFFLFTVLFLLAGCAGSESADVDSGNDSEKPIPKNVLIRVDPRMELLSAMQLVAGYGEMGLLTRHEFDYVNEVREHFSAFAGHAAIGQFQEMLRKGFAFDAPVALVLHHGPPPEVEKRADPPDALLQRSSGAESADAFMKALGEFAVESGFEKFFENHTDFYAALAEDASARAAGVEINDLEDYYGYGHNSYTIVLSPLIMHGGYGPRIEREDGRFDVYSVIGPHGAADSVPYFGKEADFKEIVWHEFSHSFMNPLVDAHWDQLITLGDALFEPVSEQMSAQGYGRWKYCCNEYFVRAVVVRLTAIHEGEEAATALLQQEKGRGFVAIEALTSALEQYEAQRDQYSTSKDFGPILVEALEEAASALEGQ